MEFYLGIGECYMALFSPEPDKSFHHSLLPVSPALFGFCCQPHTVLSNHSSFPKCQRCRKLRGKITFCDSKIQITDIFQVSVPPQITSLVPGLHMLISFLSSHDLNDLHNGNLISKILCDRIKLTPGVTHVGAYHRPSDSQFFKLTIIPDSLHSPVTRSHTNLRGN